MCGCTLWLEPIKAIKKINKESIFVFGGNKMILSLILLLPGKLKISAEVIF